jgi:hypothetical protein
MARNKLPDEFRRPSITAKIPVVLDEKNTFQILITVGFRDKELTQPYEVFCADWKAGTALHGIVMDSCIMFSRLLQYGDSPDELVKTFCTPPSLIGVIAETVCKLSRREDKDEKTNPVS